MHFVNFGLGEAVTGTPVRTIVEAFRSVSFRSRKAVCVSPGFTRLAIPNCLPAGNKATINHGPAPLAARPVSTAWQTLLDYGFSGVLGNRFLNRFA
jgi:hypothetical protein